MIILFRAYMFRRPLASVLSSISIRSILSTRLFSAPTISGDDEITTVQTTGIRWAKDQSHGSMNGIYWGEGDPRNTKVVRDNDTTNSQSIMLQSVMMALQQAKKDGLKRIRVRTDSELNGFSIRAAAKMFSNLDPIARKNPLHSNLEYCEQIAKIMDEMEVIFEHRKVSNNERDGNEVIDLLEKEGRTNNNQITTVQTTGIRWMRDGHHMVTNAIYWGEGDSRNTKLIRNHGPTDFRDSRLRSILIALEQAKKDGLKRVRINSDLEIAEIGIRSEADKFKSIDIMSFDEKELPKVVYCDRIVKIMDEMEVTFEYRALTQVGSEENEVISLINVEKEKCSIVTNFNSPEYESDWIITPNDASPLEGRTVPTVYVTGRMQSGNQVGVSAALWVPEFIKHLEINKRHHESIKQYPISTLPELQLKAIRRTIKQARSFNLPEIQVITDSLYFIHFFKKDWKKQDGRSSSFEGLYLDIKSLTETIKVHFKGVRLPEDEMMKKVYEMAKVSPKLLKSSKGRRKKKNPYAQYSSPNVCFY